jgi:hypothetical protein
VPVREYWLRFTLHEVVLQKMLLAHVD